MAWEGFFAVLYPGLCVALWWLLWLGLSTNSWWLKWASNPEEQQCWATMKQDELRGNNDMQHFLSESPAKEEEGAEELVEMVNQHYQDFEKRNQVDKWGKKRVRMVCVCVCLLIFKYLCLFVSVGVCEFEIVTWHLTHSYVDLGLKWHSLLWSELIPPLIIYVWTPRGMAATEKKKALERGPVAVLAA